MRKLLQKLMNLLHREPKIDTLKELQHFRDVEDQTEKVCKILKCQPDEINAKISKVLNHISELETELKVLQEKEKKVIDK